MRDASVLCGPPQQIAHQIATGDGIRPVGVLDRKTAAYASGQRCILKYVGCGRDGMHAGVPPFTTGIPVLSPVACSFVVLIVLVAVRVAVAAPSWSGPSTGYVPKSRDTSASG